MATYYDIFGQKVQYLASDPSPVTTGQVWYNSTSNTAKVEGYATAAWTTGNNMTGTSVRAFQSTGSVTAAVANGGVSSSAHINQTSNWDGTSWSTGTGSPVSGYSRVGFGTQTAAVFAGGQNGPSTLYTTINEYNGSSWTTSPGTLAQTTRSARGTGTQTAGFIAAGSSGDPPTKLNQAYDYDGTCVAAVTSAPTAVDNAGGSGSSQSAFILYGGEAAPGITNATVNWNGTSWTTLNSLNNGSQNVAGTFSSSTSALFAATSWPAVAPNEQWDGTCWTVIANLSSQRVNSCGSGTGASAFIAGGYDNSGPDQNTLATELWTGTGPVTKTLTTS